MASSNRDTRNIANKPKQPHQNDRLSFTQVNKGYGSDNLPHGKTALDFEIQKLK